MKVETYEVEEIQDELGQMAADSESAELIEKLGLEGQRKLLNAETCTRFPYRLMTKTEHKVFSLLFPERVKLYDYSDSIIPVRVLQVAAFVKENAPPEMKAGLYVWHSGSAKEDPLLVGHTSEYGGQFFLLARWGDALLSFDEMAEKAKKLWIVKARAKIRKEIEEWESDESNLTNLADELFQSGNISQGHNNYTLQEL